MLKENFRRSGQRIQVGGEGPTKSICDGLCCIWYAWNFNFTIIWDPLKVQNAQDYSFYISAEYDFDKSIWRSGWFEIESEWWKKSETNDFQYPILNDRMFFYNNFVKTTNFTGDSMKRNGRNWGNLNILWYYLIK